MWRRPTWLRRATVALTGEIRTPNNYRLAMGIRHEDWRSRVVVAIRGGKSLRSDSTLLKTARCQWKESGAGASKPESMN
jgi:hypothetical protein